MEYNGPGTVDAGKVADCKMDEQEYNPDAQERTRLQELLDCVPKAARPLDEVLAAWKSGTETRRLRRGVHLTPERRQHEINVGRFWENAISFHFQMLASRHREKEFWTAGVAFLVTHSDESPQKAVETLLPLVVRPGSRNYRIYIGLVVSLMAYGILKTGWLSYPLSWSLVYVVLIAALLDRAKDIRCRMIFRSLPEQEALEAYCDVLAGSAIQAVPWPAWLIVMLVIAISLAFYLLT